MLNLSSKNCYQTLWFVVFLCIALSAHSASSYYACSSCGSDIKTCNSIPKQLEKIKTILKQGRSE
ncbi:MAG: hypothetical protein DRQ39_09780 [Gammaproteobacteria bacterium]|nr:MAG: hypothetical protein DRQ39_09780 [Gammaproteobacteria bacterium]RKZ95941.1 MAG: hypothetical protein DRQ40_02295 [Gammaproteobacteria bacterium]